MTIEKEIEREVVALEKAEKFNTKRYIECMKVINNNIADLEEWQSYTLRLRNVYFKHRDQL